MSVIQTQGISSNPYTPNSMHRRNGPQKVFVYGTLKKGFHNHKHFLANCKELGEASIEGYMFHLGGCPAINLSEAFSRILGEVYEVTWDEILAMDMLEGVGRNFYDRIEAKVIPHGTVWMYVFPHAKAAKEEYVVPSGVWTGVDTVKVKWGGFGKGIEIGSFQAQPSLDEIKVGPGNGNFVLRRSELDQTYKLINKNTLEVVGSYKHLRTMVGRDGVTKPVLSLPAITRATTDSAVKEVLNLPYHIPPSQSIVWDPPRESGAYEILPKEEKIPQAARLLGIKYGEA